MKGKPGVMPDLVVKSALCHKNPVTRHELHTHHTAAVTRCSLVSWIFLSAYFIFSYVCLCWEMGARSHYECRYPNEIEDASRCPGAGVTSSHELPGKGSGK